MNPRIQQRDESIKSMLSRLSLGLKKLHLVAMIRFSSIHFIRMIGKLIVAFDPLVISNSSPGLEFTREKKNSAKQLCPTRYGITHMDSDSDFSDDHEVIIIVSNY